MEGSLRRSECELRAGVLLPVSGVGVYSVQLDQQDLLVAVDFLELDFDDFAGEVGTMRPMKVAWMGSSRWPRSMRTRSCTLLGRPWSKRASSAARMVRPV